MLIESFFLPNVCFKPLIVYFKHLQCFLHSLGEYPSLHPRSLINKRLRGKSEGEGDTRNICCMVI